MNIETAFSLTKAAAIKRAIIVGKNMLNENPISDVDRAEYIYRMAMWRKNIYTIISCSISQMGSRYPWMLAVACHNKTGASHG